MSGVILALCVKNAMDFKRTMSEINMNEQRNFLIFLSSFHVADVRERFIIVFIFIFFLFVVFLYVFRALIL